MVNKEMKKIFEEEGIDQSRNNPRQKEIFKLPKEGIKDENGKYVIRPDLSNANKALDALEQYFQESKKSFASWELESDTGLTELMKSYEQGIEEKKRISKGNE
ncbi:MAG: hypothetical protein U5K00_12170 [Melioribacteraceae bacterium]|nr:hypothetical protein [Melioribacteraceae bacterium]